MLEIKSKTLDTQKVIIINFESFRLKRGESNYGTSVVPRTSIKEKADSLEKLTHLIETG